jgi:hypothetical protein
MWIVFFSTTSSFLHKKRIIGDFQEEESRKECSLAKNLTRKIIQNIDPNQNNIYSPASDFE